MSTTTRRVAIQGSVVTGIASLVTSALAAGRVNPKNDPVLDLYRRWRLFEDIQRPLNDRHELLRNAMVERWGECAGTEFSAHDLWSCDPDYRELSWLTHETTRLCDKNTDFTEHVMKTPISTREGMVAKLRMLAFVQPPDGKSFFEDMAIEFLNDAVRFLDQEKQA